MLEKFSIQKCSENPRPCVNFACWLRTVMKMKPRLLFRFFRPYLMLFEQKTQYQLNKRACPHVQWGAGSALMCVWLTCLIPFLVVPHLLAFLFTFRAIKWRVAKYSICINLCFCFSLQIGQCIHNKGTVKSYAQNRFADSG